MGFWDGYRASLKPRDVEEPIDLLVHRPLGYVFARLSLPTRITPNQLTVLSILLALAGGACLVVPFTQHLVVGAICIVMSAVIDCSDGMLARMRKSSSALGRMLDGVADSASLLGAVAGSTWVLWNLYRQPWWLGALVLVGAFVTVYSSQFHTLTYDHYKNVYCRMTEPDSHEGEDLDKAIVRWEQAQREGVGFVRRVTFYMYLGYLRGQRDFLARVDPWTPLALDGLPAYDERRAALYREHALGPMKTLRNWFGVGSLIFGMASFDAFGRPDIYMALRLVVLNAVFWLWWAPRQRRASREAFEAMGITPPRAPTEDEMAHSTAG